MTHVRFRLLLVFLGSLAWLGAQGCEGGCNEGALSGSAGFTGAGRAGTLGSTGGIGGAAGSGGVSGLSGTGAIGPSGGAAAGGRGGRGGTSGTGGRSVMTGETCIQVDTPACPATTCGNNRRDTCSVPSGMGLCPNVTVTEECDGTDVAGQTCEGLGYGSGTLRCLSCNQLDTSSCEECRPSDASILRCGATPMIAFPFLPAIAGSATEVGLVWGAYVNDVPVINFGRLTADLDLVSSTRAVMAGAEGAPVWGLDVAPLPSGWLVSAYVDPSVLIVALDATGKVVQRRAVKVLPSERFWAGPVFAAQPSGQSIIAWQSEFAISAALIEPDGSTLTLLPDLAITDPTTVLRDAVFANGAFHVAYFVDTPTNAAQTRLVRVSTTGAIDGTFDILPDVDGSMLYLVPGGSDLRVIYQGMTPVGGSSAWAVLWQRLTATGATATPPTVLGREPQFVGIGHGVGFEDDTVVLLSHIELPPALSVTRVASSGSISYPNFKLTSGGSGAYLIDITRRGPDAVAMWVNDRGIRLARLAIQGSVR